MFPSRRATMGGDVFRDEFSLEFDGSNDYILIPEQTHSLDDTNYSYVFWVKRDATNSIHAVLGGSESASRHIRFSSDGLLAIESNTAGDEASGTLHTDDTNWHHYAVVVGGGNGTVSMYQDGKVLSVANSDLEADWTFDRIGVEGSSREFNGKMSEIAIYNKALSASEVATLYNGREPYNHKEGVCAPNLETWYRMGDGDQQVWLDTAGIAPDLGFIEDSATQPIFTEMVTGWTNTDFSTAPTFDGVNVTNAIADGSSSQEFKSNQINATVGDIYRASFTITGSDIPASGLQFKFARSTNLGTSAIDYTISAAGEYKMYIQAEATDSTSYVGFRALDVTCNFNVSNFTCKKITGGENGIFLNSTPSSLTGNTP